MIGKYVTNDSDEYILVTFFHSTYNARSISHIHIVLLCTHSIYTETDY